MLRPDTLAFTAILAFLAGMSPIATDIYLPSLPAIGRAYAASDAEVQLTLSVFPPATPSACRSMVRSRTGSAASRARRRPRHLSPGDHRGAVFAPSIEALIAIRFVQALGAAGPSCLSRSVVRDIFSGQRAVRELSRMGSIAGIVPAFAPTLGGVMEGLFGWRSSFWLMGIAARDDPRRRGAQAAGDAARSAPSASRRARSCAPTACACAARPSGHTPHLLRLLLGPVRYVSGSSFVLQGYYHLNEVAFGAPSAPSRRSLMWAAPFSARGSRCGSA